MTGWPPMIWIGGAPGAGKSTLAGVLAHAHDLPLHPIDRWTYDHAGRMSFPDIGTELAQGARAAAVEDRSARERLEGLLERDVV